MAYITIPQADIEVGKPGKKSIFQKTRDNFEDHEARISANASANAKVPLFTVELANLQQYSPNNSTLFRIGLLKADRDLRIVNVQIYVLHGGPNQDVAPTSGTLEVDLVTGTALSSLTTIFSVKPSVTTFAEEDTNGAVSFIPDGEELDQGDWLQLDITSLQTGQTRIFIDIYAEPR